MQRFNIAIISDLHLGPSGRIVDNTSVVTSSGRASFIQQFRDICHGLNDPVDFLLMPGDFTTTARPREFEQASKIITDIATAMNVPIEKIIFVPGNHDVDWAVIEADPDDPTGFRRKQRYGPLSCPDWIFGSRFQDSHKGILDHPYMYCINNERILLVGYNSSWHDDPSISVHHGLIDPEHIRHMHTTLARVPYNPEQLRIFIVHHHLMQYSDPFAGDSDFSVMMNAGELLSLLRSHRFDLVVSGHKHAPHFETYIIDSSWPLTILSAGSFSVNLDSRWNGIVNNMFHLLKVDDRHPSNNSIYGKLYTWAYLYGKGWVPSTKHNGILHVIPFGANVNPYALQEALRPIILEGFKTRDYLDWNYLCRNLSDLEYLAPSTAIDVLKGLADQLSFIIHGDPPSLFLLHEEEGSNE